MENESSPSCSTCGPWWRLPLLLALVLAAIVWWRLRGHGHATVESGKDRPTTIETVDPQKQATLTVDYGNGRRKAFDPVSWREGMTVADMLKATFGVVFVQKGSGQSTFLTAIDGVENQGTVGNNWTYSVNGVGADRSFAVFELQPGDQVLWTFGPQK